MLIKALNSPNKVTAQEQSDQKGNCKPWNWSGTTSLHAESAGQHSCGSQPPSRDVNTLRPRRPQANLSHWVRATWTDLEIAILSEIGQIDQNKYRMIALICGIQKWYKWTYLQNRNRPTDIENKLNNYQRWKGREGINQQFRVNIYISLSRWTTEWARLDISSRKLEISREHFMQRWVQ